MSKQSNAKRWGIPAAIGVLAVVAVILFTSQPKQGAAQSTQPSATPQNTTQAFFLDDKGNLVIDKASVSEQAVFADYDANGTAMQVLAVKASDGTVRTAFNTCQVCNGSPYAYFVQEGNELVCQNCKNRFKIDQVGLERGGCNPAPIGKEDKQETDTQITFQKSFLDGYGKYFTNWKVF